MLSAIKARWLRLVIFLAIELPTHRRSYAELAERLSSSGREIGARAAAAADSPRNRRQLRHIIGIERWGQRRLEVALGAPPVSDEYDGYRPADAPLAELAAAFAATRQESIALAGRLANPPADAPAMVAHNQFGSLSARGWLRYLTIHASAESKRLR